MEIAKLVIDFLRVFLSLPVIVGAIVLVSFRLFGEDIKALLLRVAKIRFPGGAELSTSQDERRAMDEQLGKPQLPAAEIRIPGLPQGLTPQQRQTIEDLLRAEKATAFLWEYRYLNYFLVYGTQMVLDWLISLNRSTTCAHYDAIWLPAIPSAQERAAIIAALETHHLLTIANNVMEVTPKGREYQQWRGPLPQLPMPAPRSG